MASILSAGLRVLGVIASSQIHGDTKTQFLERVGNRVQSLTGDESTEAARIVNSLQSVPSGLKFFFDSRDAVYDSGYKRVTDDIDNAFDDVQDQALKFYNTFMVISEVARELSSRVPNPVTALSHALADPEFPWGIFGVHELDEVAKIVSKSDGDIDTLLRQLENNAKQHGEVVQGAITANRIN